MKHWNRLYQKLLCYNTIDSLKSNLVALQSILTTRSSDFLTIKPLLICLYVEQFRWQVLFLVVSKLKNGKNNGVTIMSMIQILRYKSISKAMSSQTAACLPISQSSTWTTNKSEKDIFQTNLLKGLQFYWDLDLTI